MNLRIEAEKWIDQAPKGPCMGGEADPEDEHNVPYSIEVLEPVVIVT